MDTHTLSTLAHAGSTAGALLVVGLMVGTGAVLGSLAGAALGWLGIRPAAGVARDLPDAPPVGRGAGGR